MANFFNLFNNCRICPRNCGVNRNSGELGYCGSTHQYHISSITVHTGEEPPISGTKGICNVFFSHCNMRCIYCQNYEISRYQNPIEKILNLDEVLTKIELILKTGINALGFVSPTHFMPQVVAIISELRKRGYSPTTVWNSNAYEHPAILRMLEPYIDIYLPDFKYIYNEQAEAFSDVSNYPEIATKAIKEMHYQKGKKLVCNNEGIAVSGTLIRHLILPESSEKSMKLIRYIADTFSERSEISIMSQYFPASLACNHAQLGRSISHDEYNKVLQYVHELGFPFVWIQDFESQNTYKPNFGNEKPFE